MGQVKGTEFQFCKMKRCRDLFHNNMIWNFLLVQRWGLHTFLSGAWIWSSTRELSWMDWLDLLEVYGTLKSLLQHHSSKASILRYSAFFTVQLSHPFTTTGKTVALTRQTFVGKVMSLLLNMLSTLVITFPPRSKRLWIAQLKQWQRQQNNTVTMSVCALVSQLYLTLWVPIDYSLSGSFVHGILQAIILKWVAISFSKKAEESVWNT